MPLDLEPIRARLEALNRWEGWLIVDDADADANKQDERVFAANAPRDIADLLDEVEAQEADLRETVYQLDATAEMLAESRVEVERLRAELDKVEPRFIVRLEPGCWLAPWKGDPGRTCVRENAFQFRTERTAKRLLKKARYFRPFPDAAVERVP